MIHIVVFHLVQIAVAAFALARGGGPERTVAGLMLAAAAATDLLPYSPASSFRTVEVAGAAIDLTMLGALVGVALVANRFWPMWIAALQLDAVAIHGVRAVDQELVPIIYAWATGQIAYPMMALLVIGTIRHRRRLTAAGGDLDWTWHDPGSSERLAARPG